MNTISEATKRTDFIPETRLIPHGLIKPNEHNPRTISEKNFDKLVQSIISLPEMLSYRPLVVFMHADGFWRPLGGNMRLQALPKAIEELQNKPDQYENAAEKLEFLCRGVPCIAADDWSQEMRDEFIIKDNVQFGEWNYEMLANMWDGKTLDRWGVTIPDFKAFIKPLEAREDNYNCKLPKHAKTILGDVYELNGHRLSCGDSQDRFVVTALMAGSQAHLCMTSPPYWVGKDYETQDNEEAINDFIGAIAQGISLAVSQDYGRVVINTGTASINRIDRKRKVEILPLIDKWANALRDYGWLMRHVRIWVKRGQLPASISPKTDVIDQHNEYISCFEQEWSQVMTYWNPDGDQRGMERLGTPWAQQGVWDDIHGEKSSKGHNAAFPVEIPARNILLYTKRKELVFEPFCGSGTTLIASEQLDRKCYANELTPGWCDVTVKRWVAWMRLQNLPFTVLRNGKDISQEMWIYED